MALRIHRNVRIFFHVTIIIVTIIIIIITVTVATSRGASQHNTHMYGTEAGYLYATMICTFGGKIKSLLRFRMLIL
jgi:TRAP-type C4-dicarboxylate transport system permease small subunit